MELPSLALAGLRVETMTISQSQGAFIIIRIKNNDDAGKNTKDPQCEKQRQTQGKPLKTK